MIYLASPYSHESQHVRAMRWDQVCRAAGALIASGSHVFSPIAHSHAIATAGNLATDFDAWRSFDLKMLAVCDELVVLKLDGWQESEGIQSEIQYAIDFGMPVSYMDWSDEYAAESVTGSPA